MKRVWWKVVAGVLITLLCTALALPTLGVSVVPMIWGIFLILKRPRCQDCGWEP